MQSHDKKTEIAELELRLIFYEKLLDESIANNQIFAKTKVIFLELKQVSQKIIELKKIND
jgi:hypothetical protein